MERFLNNKVSIRTTMKKRGRPVASDIRQNMIEILYFMQHGYGYAIYKIYRAIYPNCTMKSIYYHLTKGVSLGEFELEEIKKEKGDYSWGSEVEKKYYKLGKEAKPKIDPRVKEYFEKQKENKK